MSNCYNNNYNPMGNFLPFDERTRTEACPTSTTNNMQHIFYTNPVTTSYPDTSGFAKFLFPDPSKCRDTGYLCKTNADSTLNLDRTIYISNKFSEGNYMNINNIDKTTGLNNINNVFR